MRNLTLILAIIILSILSATGQNGYMYNNDGDIIAKIDTIENLSPDTIIQDESSDFSVEKSKSDPDTTVIKLENTKIIIISTPDTINITDIDTDKNYNFTGHYAGFEFGMAAFLNPDMKLNTLPEDYRNMSLNTSTSWSYGLNFMQGSIPLWSNNIGLVTGMGIEFNRYSFDKNITLKNDSASLYSVLDTVNTFEKNKLCVAYLEVPLLLEFQVKDFYINAGVYGGVKIGSKLKQESNDQDIKIKEDFHTSVLRYGVMASVGYGQVDIFARYSMSQLFEKNEGPELYPLTIGAAFRFGD